MIRENIAKALKSQDKEQISAAVADWLSGFSTDQELSDRIEMEPATLLKKEGEE
ncbi:MAG: hypothetical protein HN368_13660 [Spirochaetales bacterium]|jgi:hypothetical protein|nr:hypothetical protein [Spirochaetales bacterium]